MTKLRILPALLLVFALARCSSTRPPAAEATEPRAEAPADTAAQAPVEEAVATVAPTEAPDTWFLLDAEEGFPGVSVDKTYQTLLDGKEPARTVVVAVIDSGIDIEHEDLEGQLWTNEDELPGNGVDDDGNGYVDDVHGWNFIGGADGANVDYDTYELTREYVKLSDEFEGMDASDVPADRQERYAYYQEIRAAFEEKVAFAESQYADVQAFEAAARRATALLRQHLGKEEITPEDLEGIDATSGDLGQAKQVMMFMFANGIDAEALAEFKEHLETDLQFRYNMEYDPRSLVGDDYADASERFYGNADVEGPDAKHGTHVAGIIAANRENGIGAEGVAAPARIMAIRAVPEGDERDKDVANAIRYAADNGAHIINMSFGKGYSPEKAIVDEAIRYADSLGVLFVHGAGNDAEDVDVADNFPSDVYADGRRAGSWIEVGAISWKGGDDLVATFSNYGQDEVDLFAPGVDMYSTLPGDDYGDLDGTSMAAPVVAGVAALVMAYYPELTASEVKEILLESAVRPSGQRVLKPGTDGERVDFAELSATGGIVNAYEAVERAEQQNP